MTRSEISLQSSLVQESRYFKAQDRRRSAIAGNPALNVAYKQRDRVTGRALGTTGGGGQVRAEFISNSALKAGAVFPAFSRGGGGFADVKPIA